jgi:transcription initiation factor TFIIB
MKYNCFKMDSIYEQFIPAPSISEIPQEMTCTTCGGCTRTTEDGFKVCSNFECGTLIIHVIDEAPEWRFYEESASNPTRCGLPINPLLPKSSYGCKIGRGGKSSYEMIRISRCNEWLSMPYSEIAKYNSFQYITLMANNAGIPKMIVDEACIYHSQISEHQTFRGLNKDGIIAASIYIACRIQNIPRTAKEIARMFHLDSTSATKGCRNAMTIINEIEQHKLNDSQIKYTNTTPSAFIDRYCSYLNMAADYITLAKFVAMKIEKQNMIPEHTPNSVATGIIYLISNEFELNISKKDIQQVSDISEVTINKCFQTIEHLKHLLIPSQAYTMFKSRA